MVYEASIINWSGILFFIVLPLLITAAIIYFAAYKKRANKAIRVGVQPPTRRMPSPPVIWAALAAIALVVCIIVLFRKLNDLERQIHANRSFQEQKLNAIENSIGSLIFDIDERFNEQERIFSSIDIKAGGFNTEKETASLTFEAVPKGIIEDGKVTLSIFGEEYELERKGSVFTASVELDLFSKELYDLFYYSTFEGSETVSLSITENGIIRTQTIDKLSYAYDNLINEYAPNASCSLISNYKLFKQPEYEVALPDQYNYCHVFEFDGSNKEIPMGSTQLTVKSPYLSLESIDFVITDNEGRILSRTSLTDDFTLNGDTLTGVVNLSRNYDFSVEQISIFIEVTSVRGNSFHIDLGTVSLSENCFSFTPYKDARLDPVFMD